VSSLRHAASITRRNPNQTMLFTPDWCMHARLQPVPVQERSMRAAAIVQEHLMAASLKLQHCTAEHKAAVAATWTPSDGKQKAALHSRCSD
jgi:hypothetical protein